MQRAVGWLSNGTNRGRAASALSIPLAIVAVPLAVDSTEQQRMARAISRGRCKPEPPSDFVEECCVFDVEKAQRELYAGSLGKGDVQWQRPFGKVALVGEKSLGKSTLVKQLLHRNDNAVYVEASDDAYGAIYRTLCKSVWTLPWFLKINPEKSHKDIVTKVFKRVLEQTGKPVVLGIDLDAEMPCRNNAIQFVQDITYLYRDGPVASVVFASNQTQIIRWASNSFPWFEVLEGREMSVKQAKQYLKSLSSMDGGVLPYADDDDMLEEFPRTFSQLKEFAAAVDKESFCKEAMKAQTVAIEASIKRWVKAKKLYQKAIKGPVGSPELDSTDIYFMQHIHNTNILIPTQARRCQYEFKFDCTKRAAKALLGETP